MWLGIDHFIDLVSAVSTNKLYDSFGFKGPQESIGHRDFNTSSSS